MSDAGPVPPSHILELDAEGADRLLEELERTVPVRPSLVRLEGKEEALVFGDTHGDWPSTWELFRRWEGSGARGALIGLGDYIDRSPEDCPNGSVANALFLLSLSARFPDRVFLIQGNHETTRRLPVLPHNLPEEVDDLWGPEDLERFIGCAPVRVVVRGHDPDLTGRPLYGDRVLTLHTTRIYERFGGVIAATIPLQSKVESVGSLTILHLSTEGRIFNGPHH